jgi:thiol:disulfide interchange protein DsbD
LTNYGYEGDLLLPVSLTVPGDFKAATLNVELRADWLVCSEICIPETGNFLLQVPAATPSVEHAALFARAQARIPADLPSARATTRVDGQFLDIKMNALPAELRGRSLRLFPEIEGVTDASSPVEQRWIGEQWAARVPLSPQRSASPLSMHVVLTHADSPKGARVQLTNIGPWPGQPGSAVTAPLPAPRAPPALVVSLALAFLGGVLLNLMPCVFPILSLKMLSFAQPGHHARRALTAGGVAYTVGVVASFLLLAGLLLGFRAGGEQLGWGFQLQSPAFVTVLAAVFTLIGLNLAGVFEFAHILPGNLAGVQVRHPIVDHALTGVLAVAVASPCTAPFMGAALGAALVMPASQALLVFAALGLGMAMPYLLASLFPGVIRWIPRPGAWMVRFKVLMAFPMFATVVWLLWVVGQQTGTDGAIGVLAMLLALAFLAWALGAPGFGRKARWGFGFVAVLVLAATVTWAWPPKTTTAKVAASADSVWAPWSPESVIQAQAQGRPVFVDFTAAWCITCQWNKRSTLSDATVLAGFNRRGVLLLRADWTSRDPRITEELARLGRNGVPVYALYLPGAPAPRLLPEILRTDEIHRVLAELSPTDG